MTVSIKYFQSDADNLNHTSHVILLLICHGT